MFLIDEFGTGSDPELGGALAEVILEDFIQKVLWFDYHPLFKPKAFDEQPAMINANMQFVTVP